MDMSLPVVDGWEATRRIKAEEATRKIPVIALTAHAMAGDREKAIEAGCDDYDTKPVELPRLLGKMVALLENVVTRDRATVRRRLVRTERALVAYVRQELSAPVTAVIGYAEMLTEDALHAQRTEALNDLKRILDASQALDRGGDAARSHRLPRHEGIADLYDFRRGCAMKLTPINAIKGYGEMLREDAIDGGDASPSATSTRCWTR